MKSKNNWMSTKVKIAITSILIIALALVRFFENELFYDPLINFFKGNYQKNILPDYDYFKLIASTSSRFILNTLISLLIVWVIFHKKNLIKFCFLFYGVAFLILITLFSILVWDLESSSYFVLFYVRRFLIQPIFIIILLPAFYYQLQLKKND